MILASKNTFSLKNLKILSLKLWIVNEFDLKSFVNLAPYNDGITHILRKGSIECRATQFAVQQLPSTAEKWNCGFSLYFIKPWENIFIFWQQLTFRKFQIKIVSLEWSFYFVLISWSVRNKKSKQRHCKVYGVV